MSEMAPVPYRVRSKVVENAESVTLCLEPTITELSAPRPGEFMMLYAYGVGEIAISVSGDPSLTDGTITHTIRSVGAVSAALCALEPGATVGCVGRSGPPGAGGGRRGRPRHRRGRRRAGPCCGRLSSARWRTATATAGWL